MPTYDYECSACHEKIEVFQKITEEPLTKCPGCMSDALVRGIGGGSASFRFVGSGFYITDYKDANCPCGQENSCTKKDP